MAGQTALLQRRVKPGFGERLAVMTGQTEILTFRIEELRIGRVMSFMAAVALPVLNRFVQRLFAAGVPERRVASLAERRRRLPLNNPADQTVRQVAGFTILLLHRQMHVANLITGHHLRVTLGTGLLDAAGGAWRRRAAGGQQQHGQ